VSYLDNTNGDLKYATCLTACATATNWQTVAVDVTGIVGFNTDLTVEGSGRIHVTYHDITNRDLKYATCAVSCTTAASWQVVTVEATGDIGSFSSVRTDASGRLHVSYYDASNADLKYATCAAGCTTAANWQTVIVDATGFTGGRPSLWAEATGRLHVGYSGSGGYTYATCTATCTTSTNWQTVTVDAAGGGAGRSLAIDGNGRLHTSYYAASGTNLKYATCASACATAANWQNLTLGDTTGIVGQYSSLAVDVSGRVHVTYYDAFNADLEYATCAVACATLAGWRFATADAVLNVGEDPSLVVDASGRLHVTYYDGSNTALKYVE